MALYEPRSGPSPHTKSSDTLILYFSIFRTVEINFCCFWSTQYMVFCYGSLRWQRLCILVNSGHWRNLHGAPAGGCSASLVITVTDLWFVPTEKSMPKWKPEEVLEGSVSACMCVCMLGFMKVKGSVCAYVCVYVCIYEGDIGVSGLCPSLKDSFQNCHFINWWNGMRQKNQPKSIRTCQLLSSSNLLKSLLLLLFLKIVLLPG